MEQHGVEARVETAGATGAAAPDGGPRQRAQLRPRRRVLVAVVGAVLVGLALALNRSLVADAGRALSQLDALDIAGLVALWLAWIGARAALQRWSLAHASATHGVVLAEVDVAAQLLPSGAVGSFAARLAVGRALGHTPTSMTVSFAVVSEAMATALWLLVLTTSIRDLITGRGDGFDVAGVIAAGAGLAATALVAWIVVRPNRLTDALVRAAGRVQRRLARRFPRVGSFELTAAVDEARATAADLIRRRAVGLVAIGLAVHGASAAVLWAGLEAVGADGGGWGFWNAFALVTAAVGFAPTPAGVGFAEGGLAAALVATGVPLEQAAAAVVIHRVVTLLLPLLTGGVAYVAFVVRPRRATIGATEPLDAVVEFEHRT